MFSQGSKRLTLYFQALWGKLGLDFWWKSHACFTLEIAHSEIWYLILFVVWIGGLENEPLVLVGDHPYHHQSIAPFLRRGNYFHGFWA